MPALSVVFAAVALTATTGMFTPIDWPTIGLRVSMRDVVTQEGPRALPYVEAVQEDSPAFFVGVRPGDVVEFVKCGRWAWNFIDASATGGTHYRTYTTVADAENPRADNRVASACTLSASVLLISVATPPDDARRLPQFLESRTADATSRPWITSRTAIAAAVDTARAKRAASIAGLYSRAATELRRSPCSYDVSVYNDITKMPPIVQEIVAAERAATGGEELMFWRDVMNAYCSDATHGPLPSFETAVFLMTTGHLDPCEYDAQQNYVRVLDVPKRLRPISWDEYNTKDFDYMFGRLLDEPKRDCFLRVVRASVRKP